MPADERYVRQVGLLVRALPLVAEEKCFALEGGTAINIVYLISHGRPIAELLAPARRELDDEFARGLAGIVETSVTLDDLLRTREDMVAEVVGGMPDEHRAFPASFERGDPDWSLLGAAHARTLPAVRWRMMNVARLDAGRRADQVGRLERALAGTERRG